MSPALFERQLADGAWGMTLATVQQVRVARANGIGRIVLANQLVGRQAIDYIAAELARDPAFDFYCLVDSIDGVRQLTQRLEANPPGRPLQVMVEIGAMGGRTGCRTDDAALGVARAVKQSEPLLSLRGIEGYEGMVRSDGDRDDAIRAFLDRIAGVAAACAREDLFAAGPVILSAGGSAFYDMVADRLGNAVGDAGLGRETLVLLRSGCYLTHDSKSYETMFQQIRDRMPEVDGFGPGPMAALEVWAYVQSRPQRDKAILTVGKRDISYDVDLPVPTLWFRPGLHDAPVIHAGGGGGDGIERPARPPVAAARNRPEGRRHGGFRHFPSLHHLRQVAGSVPGQRPLRHRIRCQNLVLTADADRCSVSRLPSQAQGLMVRFYCK